MTESTIYMLVFVLAGIRLAHQYLLQGPLLSESDYRGRWPLVRALRCWKLGLPLAMLTAIALWAPTSSSWIGLTGPAGWTGVRLVAAIVACALAWSFSTYARNLFLQRIHAFERVLLILLAGLIWVHPAAIAPFLAVLIVLMRQFEHPSCFLYSQTHARLPIDLMLATGLWPAATVLFGADPAALPLVWLTIAGCSYWTAGVAKLRMGHFPGAWVLHNRVHKLAVSARQQGWLRGIPMPVFLRFAAMLRRVDVALAVATLAIELAGVAMLSGRVFASTLLCLLAAMHAAILLSSGINFWKWAAADLALAWLVWSMPESVAAAVFTPENLAISIAIMAAQAAHLRCVELGWFDTRLSSFFRLEVVGRSGCVYRLWPGALAPFDMIFAQHRHYHLCPMPMLSNTYGTLYVRGKRGWDKYRAIERAAGCEPAHEEARRVHGQSLTDENRNREFERFMREVLPRMSERHEVGRARDWWGMLAAPKHIYVSAPPDAWCGQEQPERVRVWFEESWYDGAEVRRVGCSLVREITIGLVGPLAEAPAERLEVHVPRSTRSASPALAQ